MGGLLSRLRGSTVGSSSFYEQYERNFERLKEYIMKLKAQQLEGQRRRSRLSSLILWYACATFIAFFAFAAWVTRQPPGTYSVRGHFLRVLPVFAWPPLAWLVHAAVMYLTSWKGRRDAARLQRAQERMRKMLTDLKDSTHYDMTLELLRKYDPEFAAAEAKQRARLRAQSPPQQRGQPAGTPSTPQQQQQAHSALSPRQLGGLVGSGIIGASSRMFPALDYIATSLIGDNPALTGALREARSEGEALRLRLARAEARVAELQAANASLRERLGEPSEPAAPSEQLMSAPPTPTSISAAARSQELLEAAAAAGPDMTASDDAQDQQQRPAGAQQRQQQQQQPAAEPEEEQQPARVTSPMLPELSLAASLSFNDRGGEGQADDEEAEVSSRAGKNSGNGNGSSDRHDEAFEFRRRPNASTDVGQT